MVGRNKIRGSGVGMGSAGGPEAGYRDSRTYVDPRPVGPKPDSQASRRVLLLSEGRCPVARREERAWLSRVECTHIQCVQRSFIGLSPLPLPACPSEGSLAAPCPYALLYLFCTPPLGKCPVIWCPLSARCWYDQLTAVHLAHAGDPLLLLCRTSGLGPRHSLGLEQMGGTLQGVDPSAVARPPQPRLLGPPGHFLPCFPKTFSSC